MLFARQLVDLRHKLAAGHYRSIRALATGNDMTLRRIARSGVAQSTDLRRLYRALEATGGPTWAPRRVREIEVQVQLSEMIARRKASEYQTATTRKLASIARYRRRVKALAPRRTDAA